MGTVPTTVTHANLSALRDVKTVLATARHLAESRGADALIDRYIAAAEADAPPPRSRREDYEECLPDCARPTHTYDTRTGLRLNICMTADQVGLRPPGAA